MKYDKQPMDKAYRFVNLSSCTEPDFSAFPNEGIIVPSGHVLEIEREKNTVVIPLKEITTFYYSTDRDKVILPKDINLERLWLFSTETPDVLYKVPLNLVNLPNSDRNYYFVVPGGTGNVVLCGDKYFDAAYQLIRL